jgi:Ca2+-binding RTX toxin-like protein
MPSHVIVILQAFGGAYSDYIEGNAGQDVILGDFGRFDAEVEYLDFQNYQSIIDFPGAAGNDNITGGDNDDFILGQEVRVLYVVVLEFLR